MPFTIPSEKRERWAAFLVHTILLEREMELEPVGNRGMRLLMYVGGFLRFCFVLLYLVIKFKHY